MNNTVSQQRAPLTAEQRRRIEADVRDLYAAARRKGNTMDAWDHRQEKWAAEQHFELGCWLFYYSARIGRPEALDDRIACARRLFEAGIHAPGYQFFTAFEFGERQFDTIFEMGDAELVIEGLRKFLPASQKMEAAFEYFGWPREGVQACLAL